MIFMYLFKTFLLSYINQILQLFFAFFKKMEVYYEKVNIKKIIFFKHLNILKLFLFILESEEKLKGFFVLFN